MKGVKRAWGALLDLVDGEDGPDEVLYDPVHVAGVVVSCFFAFGVLFWALWTLLVYEGGLFAKVGPFFNVLFTARTWSDFGYEGYPYQMGVFEGWYANLAALVFLIGLTALAWRVLEKGNHP